MATRPVDFRKGMDGLAVMVRDAMGADPFSGTVYVFRSKRAVRIRRRPSCSEVCRRPAFR
ncbi:IS66 family insertion sequence element accessory protein TnpB [Methylobacterium thuringiense]|uniref:IS66 family insertion sequence element accessory protein TnpB n=1 Tax=Methylobacterium thuringiense TaxID=1003091 RepID=UPI003570EFA1